MIDKLKQLGFSDNEAKVYIELLKGFPATAYQIAKRTGLAGANVYQVLATLLQKGLVLTTEGEKKLYSPIEPKSWLAERKAKFAQNIEFLLKELSDLYENLDEDYLIYRLKNKEAVYRKVSELIDSAEHEIYFDFFPKLFDKWADYLGKAAKRGIIVKGIVYADYQIKADNLYLIHHPHAETALKQFGNDLFTLLIDANRVIFGSFSPDGTLISCYFSQNQHLCLMLESGMRSEMVWWFLLENLDIAKLLEGTAKDFYAILKTAHSFGKAKKRNSH